MDIVDSQVHLGPGGAAEMVAALDALGIAAALIDEYWVGTPGDPFYRLANGATRTTSPTAELAAWTYPGRFSYLVRVDPRDPELAAVIRLARDAAHVRALRVSPGMTRAEVADFAGGVYDEMFALAADNGLPVFVQIAGQAQLIERIVRKYPDSRIVICHCGMPPGGALAPIIAQMEGLPDSADYWRKVSEEPHAQAFARVLQTAEFPQVALKWAHAPVSFDAAGYPNLAARPYLRAAVDAFGANRVMWASDVSVNQTGESWAELLFAIADNPELSAEERAWVLGGTARRWLNWPA
ncbi:amidohydrolase [Novosphingobium sp. G106]|uniref:amidohydrolase family protein n=1 Tax=Novosphingobium sp. G106 TaxID=2849500 RepID=UPI001C2D5598|nr:amidohydrolase family protein [Novosphingobium sp. G106]MBV1691254.1 amidohydrolase [Novosphingobium sp. G106]